MIDLAPTEEARLMRVLDGVELRGQINTPDITVLANIAASIRRGHPQIYRRPGIQNDRIVLVGSGPSLADTEQEIVDLLRQPNTKLVTLNGAYKWALEHNLIPSAQIVLDARETTARFLEPAIPQCRYYVASQCHPKTWDTVAGRPYVGIYHAVSDQGDGTIKALLDAYYLGHWHGIAGGTTVATRAIGLLRMLGYLRFELFGVDCCWLHGVHHAFPQIENEKDKRLRLRVDPTDREDLGRVFECAPWMLKQFEDFIQMIRLMGQHFALSVHGDGLLAYALSTSAAITIEEETIK